MITTSASFGNTSPTIGDGSAHFYINTPKALLYNTNISDAAFRLYLLLCDYNNGQVCPSEARLASDSGKTERQIRRILNELEAAGLIRKIASPGRVNSYQLERLDNQPDPHQVRSTRTGVARKRLESESEVDTETEPATGPPAPVKSPIKGSSSFRTSKKGA